MSRTIFGHLKASVHDHVAGVITSAETADGSAALYLARSELPRVAAALRAVLDEHRPDERGRCRSCRRRRFGRAPTPCRAYLTAHLCLLTADDDPRPADIFGITDELRHNLGATG